MKNFDVGRKAKQLTEDDRTFQLHGEHFVVLPGVHPSRLEAYDKLDGEAGVVATLEIVDELILNMIDDTDNAHARYRVIREDTNDPVTVEDLQELVKWMLEVQAGRPTGQPSGSGSGLTSIETGSTDDSSSPVTPAVSLASA